MSNSLAIAAVTGVIKSLLNKALSDSLLSMGSGAKASAVPPDRVLGENGNDPARLNLFLYQATENMGWRNVGLPSHNAIGEPLTNPPLALDLHYLLTAYGDKEFVAEALLGLGMQVLHENGTLPRGIINSVLNSALAADEQQDRDFLLAADLARQIELIKICPENLGGEEVWRLWSSLQAKYRLSAAYRVTVVLIEGKKQTRAPLPVLRQGKDDRGPIAIAPPFPFLTGAHSSKSEKFSGVALGEDLILSGDQLDDPTNMARFEHPLLRQPIELGPVGERLPTQLTVTLPGVATGPAASAWVIGLYRLSLVTRRPNLPAWTTNAVSFALLPAITVSPLAALRGTVNLTVTCMPRIRDEQNTRVSLLFGMREVQPATLVTPVDPVDPDNPANPINQQPSTITFSVPSVEVGQYVIRLRVDGMDSLPVLLLGNPPRATFDPLQKVAVT